MPPLSHIHLETVFTQSPSKAVFILLLVLFPRTLYAQFENFHETWRWVKFTTESGLPSNQIHEIEETQDGTVWVSTPLGVAWFDGYRWHSIDSTKGLSPKPALIRIIDSTNQVLVISSGKIFIGNENGFVHLPITENGKEVEILNAFPYEYDKILLATAWPLFFYVYDHGTLMPFKTLHGTVFNRHKYFWKTKSENYWVLGIEGLFKYHRGTWTQMIDKKENRSTVLDYIVENQQGDGIAVSYVGHDAGIWEWKKDKKPKHNLSEQAPLAKAVDISSDGVGIIAYESGELRLRKDREWVNLRSPFIEVRTTQSIKFRPNGDIWFGTINGLFLFRGLSKRWTSWHSTLGIQENIINEIFIASDKTIWTATQDGIEARFTNGGTRFFKGTFNERFGVITGINEDKDGNIWIGSGSSFSGSYYWNGKIWQKVNFQKSPAKSFIHKIRKDKKGHLWFLGLGSLYLGDDQPGAIQYIDGKFVRWGTDEGLLSGRVYCFDEDSSGGYWFGTRDGISRWKDGKWRHWAGNDQIFSGGIRSLIIDDQQNVWIGNEHVGVRKVTDTDEIQAVIKNGQLFQDPVFDISKSADGQLWFATTKGLFSYMNDVWSDFDYKTGLTTPRLNCVLPLENEVYVGSPGGGISILNLDETNRPTRIEFDRTIIEDQTALVRWHTYAYWGSLPPGEIESRYCIDGGEWTAWSKSKEVSLQDLAEGNHSFIVQAKDLFGSYDPSGQQITFLIKPPYYKRIEFLIPLGMLSFAVTLLFVNSYRRKRAFQKELQRNRDRIASDLHDEVGSNLGSIALINQHLQKKSSIPSSHRKELKEVSIMALQTAETLREIVWYINPSYDTLENLILRMRETTVLMLRRINYSFSLDNDNIERTPLLIDVRRNIYLSFKEILHNLVKHSHATKVEISVKIDRSRLKLKVVDNGVGFDTLVRNKGEGLKNLHKRSQELHGKVDIISIPGKGTTIIFSAKIT